MRGLPRSPAHQAPSDVDVRSLWETLCGGVSSKPEQDMLCPLCGRMGATMRTEKVARTGQLRAYGNAIVPQVAAEFISAYRLATEASE